MRIWALVLVAVTAVAVPAGCSSTNSVTDRRVDRLAEATARLPEQLRKSGVLIGGTDPTFEPMTFKEGSVYAGLDVDLANAIAAKLGLRVQWTEVPFGELLDKVAKHEIDFSVSAMYDRATRQQKADFVNYLNAGTSIVVAKGVGDVGGMAGLCGRRVAVQPETVFVDMANAQQKECGAKSLTVVLSDSPSRALQDGKADAALKDFPLASVDVQKMPTLELSGPQIEAIPYGIGVAKDRRTLTMAVQAALYQLINDGTYDTLLTKWKVTEGALKTGAINGGA